MSEARIAAVVCEGQTDVPILRGVIQNVWPELDEVRCLQPELDETERAKGPAGWSQVKAWCETNAENLGELLDPNLGDPIDLLVIAIDVDIAVEAGIIDPPQRVGIYETGRLRATMATWLKTQVRRNMPRPIVFSTPVTAIEAWIVAAFFPREKRAESISNPAGWLMKKGKLKKSLNDGSPWKELYRYRDHFAPRVAKKLKIVRKVCTEADRTLREIEQRRLELITR